MNIKNSLTLLLSILIAQFFYGQDLNQKVAIKEFKANTYKNWKVAGGYSTKEDGTRDISYKYDDDGNVNVLLLGEAEYELDYVEDYNGNKLYTGTHFRNKKGSFNIVYMSGKLYVFKMMADGSFGSVHSVIAKKGGSVEKADKQLESYAVKMQEIKKQKEIELKVVAKKNNPESFYAEVLEESEGMKRVKNKAGKYGFINSNNDLVIPCTYDNANKFFNKGLIGVEIAGICGYIDANGKEVIKLEKKYLGIIYNDLILGQESNDVYNLYDLNGKVKHGPFKSAYWDKNQLTYYVRKENDHGFLQKDNSIDWVLKNRDFDAFSVSGDFYVVGKNNKKGLIDAKTKQDILKPTLDVIYGTTEGVFVVENNKKFGLYKPKTGFITEVVYDDAYSFKNGKAPIISNGKEGSADLNGNITWGDGSKTNGVVLKTPLSAWRSDYSSSNVVYDGAYSQVQKNGLYGYVNDKGELKLSTKYSAATKFTAGIATVTIDGKSYQIDQNGETQKYEAGVGNSIEMNFGYASNGTKSWHLGVIWDKYNGKNRVFYSADIYNYDFKGRADYDITLDKLEPLIDGVGEIMMKCLPYYNTSKYDEGKPQNVIFAWNTNSGKYIKFKFENGGFMPQKEENDENLKTSSLKSDNGGRILYDIHAYYGPSFEYKIAMVAWNTVTGKNNLSKNGFSFPEYSEKIDGEIMFASGINSFGKIVGELYTTQSFRSVLPEQKVMDIKGIKGPRYSQWKKDMKFVSDATNPNYKLLYGFTERDLASKDRLAHLLIFEERSGMNNSGRTFQTYGGLDIRKFGEYIKLYITDNSYSYIRKNNNEEIGVLQISNIIDAKLEYVFWNKTTGEMQFITLDRKVKKNFVETLNVKDNLLKLVPGEVPVNIIRGEKLQKSIASNVKTEKTTNSTENNTTSNYYYIENTTNKEIKISINGGLSNHVNSGSKLKVECGKPASIMYLDGSSWKIGNQISSGKGVCGETVKY